MCDRQHRDSHIPLHGCAASAFRQTDTDALRMQSEEPCEEQEEGWRHRVHNLQECICDLLIRNQELRMSLLELASKCKSAETGQ